MTCCTCIHENAPLPSTVPAPLRPPVGPMSLATAEPRPLSDVALFRCGWVAGCTTRRSLGACVLVVVSWVSPSHLTMHTHKLNGRGCAHAVDDVLEGHAVDDVVMSSGGESSPNSPTSTSMERSTLPPPVVPQWPADSMGGTTQEAATEAQPQDKTQPTPREAEGEVAKSAERSVSAPRGESPPKSKPHVSKPPAARHNDGRRPPELQLVEESVNKLRQVTTEEEAMFSASGRQTHNDESDSDSELVRASLTRPCMSLCM